MKFDARAAMAADGIKEDATGSMSDGKFYYRIISNDVQVGVKWHFDRWANSVDFIFSLPKTPKRWKEIKDKLAKALKQYSGGTGEEIRL